AEGFSADVQQLARLPFAQVNHLGRSVAHGSIPLVRELHGERVLLIRLAGRPGPACLGQLLALDGVFRKELKSRGQTFLVFRFRPVAADYFPTLVPDLPHVDSAGKPGLPGENPSERLTAAEEAPARILQAARLGEGLVGKIRPLDYPAVFNAGLDSEDG